MSNSDYWDTDNPWGQELIVNRLLEEGVEYIFALTGGHILAVLNSAHEKGIKVVSARSEDGAVLAAVGYALATGKVGVAAFGAGMIPMAVNGACNAALGQVPVVIISGAERSDSEDRKMVQGSDILPFARAAYCKSAYRVNKWPRIPDMISRAFQDATTARRAAPSSKSRRTSWCRGAIRPTSRPIPSPEPGRAPQATRRTWPVPSS